MIKHLAASSFYTLPTGNQVYPSRLIHRDGTIMWKHALVSPYNELFIPETEAHEAHIIKTAARLEELNCWASQGLEPWDSLIPLMWYIPVHEHLPFAEGYACTFKHASIDTKTLLEKTGAKLSFSNRSFPVEIDLSFEKIKLTGALVVVKWKKEEFAIDESEIRKPLKENPHN